MPEISSTYYFGNSYEWTFDESGFAELRRCRRNDYLEGNEFKWVTGELEPEPDKELSDFLDGFTVRG